MGRPLRSITLSAAIGFALAATGAATAVQATTFALAQTDASRASEAVETFIITFSEAGLFEYRGGVAGLARTAPDTATGGKLDRHSAAARSYEGYLATRRAAHRSAIEGSIGRPLDVTHSYGITFNGIAASLTPDEAARIARLPGIQSVEPAGTYHLDTYRGPGFIGADQVWNGSSTPSHIGTKGEGVKVGIIDGGAAPNHPSFANDPSCGFNAATPKLIAVDCSSSSGGICNGSNPAANPGYGHGVHTASTVAGNTIDNTVTPAPVLPDGATMSGVAPCAQIYQYKVCETTSCDGDAILAGIENAIADGVDAINFSISGGTSPWSPSQSDRTFLDAVDAGVFVAASAGNYTQDDPTVIGKVNHRGPWMMTVAASTQDRIIGPGMSLAGPGTPPPATQHIGIDPGSTTPASSTPDWTGKPIKSYTANIEGCTESGGIPAGTFTGAIGVIHRGTCNFSEKITNAYNAGAEMVVVTNNSADPFTMNTDGTPTVPAYSIMDQAVGDAVLAFIAAHPTDATADVARVAINNRQGDVLADFSYRGPTPSPLADLTKPDITGPGVDIYAAVDPTSGDYEFMSGTSMSGPHVAGSAALLKAVHADWTPMEIRSALMMTAKVDGFQEDGTTPWNIDQVGSGRVNVANAALAGLTMDETKANFLAANPSGGSIDVKQLNVPSLRNLACYGSCSWTRTVKNRLDTTGHWTVASSTGLDFTLSASPSTFSLAPGAEQTITFTATPGGSLSGIKFGYVVLSEDGAASPPEHLSVAISGSDVAGYTIGGQVSGLTGNGLELELNGGSDLSISADGSFTFTDILPPGTAYAVTVATQPTGQSCTVANGNGTVSGSSITNVSVTCVDVTYTVGGRVKGLKAPGLELQLNGAATLTMNANGLFVFPAAMQNGSAYAVTVIAQPDATPAQTCTVGNGVGTVASANVTDVEVQCAEEPDDRIFADGFDGPGSTTAPPIVFGENFDAYAAGSNVSGQGGWKGWGGDAAAGALIVDDESASAPNSIEIMGDSDLIHELSQFSNGSWTITARQYIPEDFSGKSYFIFENAYSDTDMGIISWSTQVYFDSATNQVHNEDDAANPFTAPLVKGQWVDLKLVVDLDNDVQTFFYDGTQMYSGSWKNQFPGQGVSGKAVIGAIDLFANGASEVYYDDIRIVPTPPSP